MRVRLTVDGEAFDVEVDHERLVRVNGQPIYLHLEQMGRLPVYSLAVDGAGYVVFVEDGPGRYEIQVNGAVYPVEVEAGRLPAAPPCDCPPGEGACAAVCAPLAGNVRDLPVATGDRIEAGQVVAVVESMKMQMELKAPRAGIVEGVHGSVGQCVSQGTALITIRSE